MALIQYIIQVRDRVTGQGLHCSDFFDSSSDAIEWAKGEYGPADFSPDAYWILEQVTVVKGRCPHYINCYTCNGDVVFRQFEYFGTCTKCHKKVPIIIEV